MGKKKAKKSAVKAPKKSKPAPKPAPKKSSPKSTPKLKPTKKQMKIAKKAKQVLKSAPEAPVADQTHPESQEAMLPAPEPKLELPAPKPEEAKSDAEWKPGSEAPTSPPPAPVTAPEKGDLVLQVKLRKYYISAVKGADVLLMKDGKTIAQATTDQAGSAYFRDLTAGAYSLGTTYNNKFLTKNVVVKNHSSVTFNI